MLNKTIQLIEKIFPITEVQAHCDVPCGIYDPHNALVSCLTAIRMTDRINDHNEVRHTVEWHNEVTRYVAQKEEHAEKVKHEVRVIWGDYFKTPQFEKYPELHELAHSIMLLGSKVKQEVNKEAALELLEKLNRFAEIFWETKGVVTKRAVCPYPPSQEIVYPQLQ
jgi:nickel superoxide dismutase